VSGYVIGNHPAGRIPLPPAAEYQWRYQYYFATDRGRAGYEKYRREFAKLVWRLASPHWTFDDATFDRTAVSFDNPDHVSIVVLDYPGPCVGAPLRSSGEPTAAGQEADRAGGGEAD
jgi:hypothetical protein